MKNSLNNFMRKYTKIWKKKRQRFKPKTRKISRSVQDSSYIKAKSIKKELDSDQEQLEKCKHKFCKKSS